MVENVGNKKKTHMTDHAESPQIPSLPPHLQHKDVFMHIHREIGTHKILQHVWDSPEVKNQLQSCAHLLPQMAFKQGFEFSFLNPVQWGEGEMGREKDTEKRLKKKTLL